MGPLTSSYVLCGSREANEGKLEELTGELMLTLSLFDWSRLLYFSRSGGLLRFLVLLLAKLLLCLLLSRLLAQRLKVLSLGPKASVKAKDLIQQKSRMLSAADMRLQLGDHIMP
ncbi:Hypothetical predicted protein [Prunus dulcis]|uniref:Uncharacterized protein n=1 Tax=Prunus dulcis TaxID=3755 RepID=A0A5E4G944_PRUDU|nr:Hypothetical predicted protein [Prunus dulcis]